MNHLIEKIDAFRRKYPNTEYGPAHIVISDYNLDESAIDYCLDAIKEMRDETSDVHELEAFLNELKRDIEETNTDGT